MKRYVERAPIQKDSTKKCSFYDLDFKDPLKDISMIEI